MKLSTDGLRLIESFEGWVDHPYNDAAKPPNATIGYGHLIHPGPVNAADRTRWRTISRARGDAILAADAHASLEAVDQLVTVRLNQHQIDALVSFVFNVGIGNFAASTLLRVLNDGQYAQVPAQMNRWVHAGGVLLAGLVRRRAAEAALFSKPGRAKVTYSWLTPGERAWVLEYEKLRAARTNSPRQAALRDLMRTRRRVIWQAAQPRGQGGDGKGWNTLNRLRRYRTLRAKTT